MIPCNEVILTLWNLIETNQVQEGEFSKAARRMTLHQIRHVILGQSLRCSQLAGELRNLADFLGEAPANGHVISPSFFVRPGPFESEEGDEEMFEGCLASAAFSISRYRAALRKSLPSPISTVIRMQYDQVLEGHEQLRLLKSGMRSDVFATVGQ